MKLPSYIHLSRHRIYKFRRRIPDDLTNHLAGNEIRLTLSTSDRREAIRRARIIAVETDALFEKVHAARQSRNTPPHYSALQIKSLLRARLMTLNSSQSTTTEKPYWGELKQVSEAAARIGATTNGLLEKLLHNRMSLFVYAQNWCGWKVDDIDSIERDYDKTFVLNDIEARGYELSHSGFVRIFNCMEALASIIETGAAKGSVFEITDRAALFLGLNNDQDISAQGLFVRASDLEHIGALGATHGLPAERNPAHYQPAVLPSLPADTSPPLLLSKAIELFFEPSAVIFRIDKPATIRKDRDALKLLIGIVGEKPVSQFGQPDAKKFSKEILTFRARSQRMPSSCNNAIGSVSKFSDWVRSNHSEQASGEISFKALRYKTKGREDERRDRFEDDELKAIFTSPTVSEFAKSDLAKYWLLHIAHYSGMRSEEICQLDPQTDIIKDREVWVFDINERNGKSTKNRPSIRKTPIHPTLIELGILDYANALKESGALRLFPGTLAYEGRQSKNLGKSTNRVISSIIGDHGKTLHSFRHTIADVLKQKLEHEALTAAILGHKYGKISVNTSPNFF